jgi:hypothetical protein
LLTLISTSNVESAGEVVLGDPKSIRRPDRYQAG